MALTIALSTTSRHCVAAKKVARLLREPAQAAIIILCAVGSSLRGIWVLRVKTVSVVKELT